MTSRQRYGRTFRLMLAGIGAVSLSQARAQAPAQTAPALAPWAFIHRDIPNPAAGTTAEPEEEANPEASEAPDGGHAADKTPDPAKTPESPTTAGTATSSETADTSEIDINKLDWSQLNMDGITLTNPPLKKTTSAKAAPASDVSWSSQDKSNGASAVTVKQPISTFLDAKIGADMNVVRQPTTSAADELSQRLANGGNLPQSSGSAWATLNAPGVGSIWDKTSVEARVDPSQDQSKLGTSLSKSLPLNQQYSVTLQNGYSVIEQNALPVPGLPGHALRNYQTDQSAKLSIADTGTSFTAGQTLSTTDDKWLRKIGAEQKLFGGVSINGSIGETPYGPSNKSLTAGFKQSW